MQLCNKIVQCVYFLPIEWEIEEGIRKLNGNTYFHGLPSSQEVVTILWVHLCLVLVGI